ncbi:MAG: hypothetical protein IIZ83_06680 [Oscillospiraceae bacterium]|nr:hypothetical protein [Oscillospiraceae bacterium]
MIDAKEYSLEEIATLLKCVLDCHTIENTVVAAGLLSPSVEEMSIISASIIGELFDNPENVRTVVARLIAPEYDEKVIAENGRLKREFEASQERVAQLAGQLEEAKKQIADLKKGDEPKKRAPGHKWTTEENRWIADHLNSTTDIEVSKKFGVSRQAAMSQMHRVRAQLGK